MPAAEYLRPPRQRSVSRLRGRGCGLPRSPMTAFGKLFRTTAFKLTLVYLAVFALVAAFLLIYLFLERAAPGHRPDHRHGQFRDHRPCRAVPGGWDHSACPDRECARAATGVERLSGNQLCRPADRRQRRLFHAWACSIAKVGLKRSTVASARATHQVHYAWVRVFQLPGGFRLVVGRDLEERARLLRNRSVGRQVVGCARRRARDCRRFLRGTPRAHPRGCDDRNHAQDHGRRPFGTPAGRRLRRRARSTGREPQCHARAHRSLDARFPRGLRQHRP